MAALQKRIATFELWQNDVDKRLESHEQVITELRELNQTVRDIAAAVRIFTRIGNAVKWLVGVGTAIMAFFYALKNWPFDWPADV